MARHPRWLKGFASDADLDAVAEAVSHAERGTGAEIRVHLDHRCAGDTMARAIEVFERLHMHQTVEHAGVCCTIRDRAAGAPHCGRAVSHHRESAVHLAPLCTIRPIAGVGERGLPCCGLSHSSCQGTGRDHGFG